MRSLQLKLTNWLTTEIKACHLNHLKQAFIEIVCKCIRIKNEAKIWQQVQNLNTHEFMNNSHSKKLEISKNMIVLINIYIQMMELMKNLKNIHKVPIFNINGQLITKAIKFISGLSKITIKIIIKRSPIETITIHVNY